MRITRSDWLWYFGAAFVICVMMELARMPRWMRPVFMVAATIASTAAKRHVKRHDPWDRDAW
jgi:hypothetical protein